MSSLGYRRPISSRPGIFGKLDTITLPVHTDVTNNSRLLEAMTKNVGTMLEHISQQMFEFEDVRTAADLKMRKWCERIETEVCNSHERHAEVMELLAILSKTNESQIEFPEKVLLREIKQLDFPSVHTKLDTLCVAAYDRVDDVVACMEKCTDVLTGVRNANGDLHARVQAFDHHLYSLERSNHETNELLQRILQTSEAVHKQVKNVQDSADIPRVKGWLDEHAKGIYGKIDDHAKGLHGVLDSHGKKHEDLAKMMDDTLLQHMSEHGCMVMSAMSKMPSPLDEKVLLQAIENMHEASLGETLQAIENLGKRSPDILRVKCWLEDHAKDIHSKLNVHSKELHGKLDGHGKKHDSLAKLMDERPDHDRLMKGIRALLVDHMSDHSGKIMASIQRMLLAPDENVLLQAVKHMHETSLNLTMQAIDKLRADAETHSAEIHGKFDDHSKRVDELCLMMDGKPDHESLMEGVHDLLAHHIGDHYGSQFIADVKKMLEAMEIMHQSLLKTLLEAIRGIQLNVSMQAQNLASPRTPSKQAPTLPMSDTPAKQTLTDWNLDLKNTEAPRQKLNYSTYCTRGKATSLQTLRQSSSDAKYEAYETISRNIGSEHGQTQKPLHFTVLDEDGEA